MFRPLDCLYTLNREWTLYKRWVTKSWHSKESDCHPKNLFLSLKSVMQRLGPIEKRKRNCSEWVECFGHWTVLMRWTEGGLCTRDRWLKAEPRRSQNITQQISSLVLICDAKIWSHKKEEKEMYWACQMFWPLDCLFTLNRERTLYKRWLTKDDP